MKLTSIFIASAVAEIAGCFAFWSVVRHGAASYWLAPGIASLILFAWLLTFVDMDYAGRAYAVYGGIYIAASLVWLWAVEGKAPDHWDLLGSASCILGAVIIIYGPRPS